MILKIFTSQKLRLFFNIFCPEMCQNIIFTNLKLSSKKVIVGIDEAGRGPAMGYMVYCIFVLEIDNLPSNLKDSKLLTDKTRRKIFQEIKDLDFAYKCIHPSYITTQMLSMVNLNTISFSAVIELITLVSAKFSNIEKIFIDTIGPCEKLKNFLEKKFSYNFIVESKADTTYPVVSGASIIAKVIRDDRLNDFTGNFGSGYPSDPKTKMWLKNNINEIFGWGKGIRYTWATVKNILGYNKSRQYTGILSRFYVHSE